MNEVPPAFRARIASHNRHCWLAAALSLLGAWLGWILFGAVFTGGVLLFETIRTGNASLMTPPHWYYPLGIGLLAGIFFWASVDRWVNRNRPPPDRNVIGWHLVRDVLLLPAQSTFAVWDYLGSRITLSSSEREEAWHLLQTIAEMHRARVSALRYHVSDFRRLGKLLLVLQFTDWIDLHRGDEDWFYTVRSDQEAILRAMLPSS